MYQKTCQKHVKDPIKVELKTSVKTALLRYCNCIRNLEKVQPLNLRENRFYMLFIMTTVDHCIHSATVKSTVKVQWERGHM